MDKFKGDPVDRAFKAYHRECTRSGAVADQPANYSGVEEYDEKEYVVLRNANGIMAVFFIESDGSLHRLHETEEWPEGLREEDGDEDEDC